MKRRDLALILSGILLGAVLHIHFWREDWYSALTIWPVWFWLVPGLLLVWVGWRRPAGWLLTVTWVGGVLAFMDEPHALLRSSQPAGTLRVVSLNCAGEDLAATDLAALQPDIILIQESPSGQALEELARAVNGTLVYSPDRSLIARGEVESVPLPKSTRAVRAVMRRPGFAPVTVISLRLSPHPLAEDFWSPTLWRAHTAAEREQRDELRAIVKDLPVDEPVIVGGDFNATVGAPVYRLMPGGLRDSFREAGVGWGNTLMNTFPIWRVDQVWISRHFRSTQVVAQQTRGSDHRAVVCDLVGGDAAPD